MSNWPYLRLQNYMLYILYNFSSLCPTSTYIVKFLVLKMLGEITVEIFSKKSNLISYHALKCFNNRKVDRVLK